MNYRIPTDWLHLAPGDRVSTTLPYHKIEAIFDDLLPLGYVMQATPSPRGYWIERLAGVGANA